MLCGVITSAVAVTTALLPPALLAATPTAASATPSVLFTIADERIPEQDQGDVWPGPE
ncbi:hypothetical protein AB0M36_16800 [Actinoplanes sp. NPDC051346]|uniref:hypothetical protein n=1 Tax=Actinoplanes sp. NPDC051346 TaxID=3155048 RepID=UPI00343D4F09